MFIIRDVDYDDSYLRVDLALTGIELKFVDGPEEDDELTVILNKEQLQQVVDILEGRTSKPVGNYVRLPQISKEEELDVCNLYSFEQYMLTLERAALGVTFTPADKDLLVSFINHYLEQ
ncbi:hypothetical protein HONESTABE_34 [Bacillus phage HonestAbe]|nr:hypothetical protein HONESTABE_34 [Bacillus phage HonestAbe]